MAHMIPIGMKISRIADLPCLKARLRPTGAQITRSPKSRSHETGSLKSEYSHRTTVRRHAPSMIRNAAFNVHGFGILLPTRTLSPSRRQHRLYGNMFS